VHDLPRDGFTRCIAGFGRRLVRPGTGVGPSQQAGAGEN
jgi:hypothetical protein